MSGVAAVRQLRPQSRNMSRKQAIAEYANAAVVPLVDPLVRSLLVEQPEDPAAFCQAYFQKTLGSGKGPSTPEGVETVSPELVALQQRIAALEAENQALQAEAAATPSVAVAAPEVAGTEAFVVNWNLAGVNTNAFEFHLSEDPLFADAIAFARDTDDVVRTVLRADSGDAAPDGSLLETLAPMTIAQLLSGLAEAACAEGSPEAAVQTAVMAALETVGGESLLGRLRGGMATKEFSKPDGVLKDRTWAFTNLPPQKFESFLAACQPGQDAAWWLGWTQSIASCSKVAADGVGGVTDYLVRMACFDSFIRLAAARTLEKQGVTSEEAVAALGAKLCAFVLAMNTAPAAKAAAVAAALRWLVQAFEPDFIALEEFNAGWLDVPAFGEWWSGELIAPQGSDTGYDMFEPPATKNRLQMTVLLMRRGSAMRVDEEATARVGSIVTDPALIESLKTVYAEHFHSSEKVDVLQLQLDATAGFLGGKLAFAAFTTPDGQKGLACAAHAASDGTDNRAIVICCNEIRRRLGEQTQLVVAMDANTALSFPKKGVLAGAANQVLFDAHLRAKHGDEAMLTSCWDALLAPTQSGGLRRSVSVYNSRMPHSVLKERCFLQTQWKKADHLDLSMKDWVVCTAGIAADGVTINRTSAQRWVAMPSAGRVSWQELCHAQGEDTVWEDSAHMPNSRFPSDHAAVVARLRFPSPTA